MDDDGGLAELEILNRRYAWAEQDQYWETRRLMDRAARRQSPIRRLAAKLSRRRNRR